MLIQVRERRIYRYGFCSIYLSLLMPNIITSKHISRRKDVEILRKETQQNNPDPGLDLHPSNPEPLWQAGASVFNICREQVPLEIVEQNSLNRLSYWQS